MKIAFLDPIVWDYNVETPLNLPMGGSQSALCYLAVELARLGHDVSLINNTSSTRDVLGVRCIRWIEGANTASLNRMDIVIVLNATAGARLRSMGVRAPLVLWSHNPHNESVVQGLKDANERASWTGFAFVSQWMAANYAHSFSIPDERSRVFHNGIGQPFASQQIANPWFLRCTEPLLAYTSAPNRGLNILLDAFPAIRAKLPNVRLRVYSSMSLYRVAAQQDRYQDLYERSRVIPGVEYCEPIGQVRLAQELSSAAALVYPATVAETFCLAAAEAMSVGASLITTHLGALPELFGRFASMMEPAIAPHNSSQASHQSLAARFSGRIWRYALSRFGHLPLSAREKMVETYSDLVISVLEEALRNPQKANMQRNEQIAFVRTNYNWTRVGPEWLEWLEHLIGQSAKSISRV